MKMRITTGKKLLSVALCVAPVLIVGLISRTGIFDFAHRGVRKLEVGQLVTASTSKAPDLSDISPSNPSLAELKPRAEIPSIASRVQGTSLVEQDWILRFTNPFQIGDNSIDCRVFETQRQPVNDLINEIREENADTALAQFRFAKILRKSRGADCHRFAFELFQKSAQRGYARSYAELGNAYKKGLGVSPNFKLALENFEKAAELGLANSAYRLIELTEKGSSDIPGNAARASRYLTQFIPLLEGRVRQGDAVAARSLGRLYNNSNLVQLDPEKAIEFMNYAATLGDPIAMHDLAALLIEHRPQSIDREDIYPLLLESSRLGYGAAFTAIGRLHLKGQFGFPKQGAARWFRSGVDAGHPGAMAELAELYFSGQFVSKDLKIAKDLALQGTRLNHRGSKRVLDEILEHEEISLGKG